MSNKFTIRTASRIIFALLASTALANTFIMGSVNAQPTTQNNAKPASMNQDRVLIKLVQDLQRKDEQLSKHEEELAAQKQQIEELKKLVQQLAGSKGQGVASPVVQAQSKTAAPVVSSVQSQPPAPAVVKKVGLERRQLPKDKPPQISAVPQDGGVLLAPGKMVLEPSFEYSRSSALRVAIEGFTIIPALSIGSFEISAVDRNTVTTAVAARLGLFRRFEISAVIPYVYRDETTSTRPIGVGSTATTLSNVSGMNIGDIEVSAHYQINDGKNGWPFFIGNLRLKSATGDDPFSVPIGANGLPTELSTGSGFYAIQPSISIIYPTDPAVLYSSLGYVLNLPRNIGGTYGQIDPGDSIDYSFGMGFGINENTSFSLGYSHSMIFETTQNGATIPTSDVLQVAQMTTGLSHRINERVNVNVNIGAGLTDDAPDMRFGIKVPVKLDLW